MWSVNCKNNKQPENSIKGGTNTVILITKYYYTKAFNSTVLTEQMFLTNK